MQTDSDFMLAMLKEAPGRWVSQNDILRRSEQRRGCGLTVHSRASDLRNRGFVIENKCERHGRRVVSFYRLSSLSQPSGFSGAIPSLESGGLESEAVLARPVPENGSHGRNSLGTAESEGLSSLTLFDEPQDKRPLWA